nr:tRNA (adenosine(37)-N6)-threonylcarbamoyltransferase complex dimerization subunit type 1 TsaB [Candidatus Desulfatifera sulfidica]
MSADGPVILALDTATRCCAVALTTGNVTTGTILGRLSLNSRVTHSRRLLAAVDWLMLEAGLTWTDLDGPAPGLRPGRFFCAGFGLSPGKGLRAGAQLALFGGFTLGAFAQHVWCDASMSAGCRCRRN